MRLFIATLASFAVVFAASGTALALGKPIGSPSLDAQPTDSSFDFSARLGGPGAETTIGSASKVRKANAVIRATRLVPACGGNELNLVAPADVMCSGALAMCADTPEAADMMFWVYSGPLGVTAPTPEQWVRNGFVCLTPAEAERDLIAQALPTFTLEDFRRLPLPAGAAYIEPPSLQTLVNVPTNVYVSAAPLTLDTNLLGFPVQVRARPAHFTWQLGDGTVLKTADAGGAYPNMTTTHTYVRKGRVQVQLTTSYAGEYSLAGGPWMPIDGEAEVQSPAVALTVLEARSHLVDDLDS